MVRLDTLVATILADARERVEKEAGGVKTARQLAPAEGLAIRAREGKPGCGGTPLPATLRHRDKGEKTRDTGRPVGQGKFRRTRL